MNHANKACIHLFADGQQAVLKCPVCNQEVPAYSVIDNLFAEKDIPPSASNAASEESKTCTGCEESVLATSFCQECQEWLCDQCVQAHRRVRITKDHTIQPQDKVEGAMSDKEGSSGAQPVMHCPVHKQELLRLYCQTCDKLTCRDCQLVEHKDHKYEFVEEAGQNFRMFLQTVLTKCREKQTYVDNAKTFIEKRNHEIVEREQKVANEIKVFIMKIAAELNKRGKQLMSDLQAICRAKKHQLESKGKEVATLSQSLDYALKFAEYSMEKGNHTALLHTKRALITQLRSVLKTRCEVPNPFHVVDIKFNYDTKAPVDQLCSMGSIFVEGFPFDSQKQRLPQTVEGTSSTSSGSQLPGAVPGRQPSVGGQVQPLSQTTVNQTQNRPSASQSHPAQNDKNQLQSYLKHQIQQKRMHHQMQPHHSLQHRIQQQQQTPMSVSPTSSSNMHPSLQNMQRLSHLPHQSSSISSSNSRSHGMYHPYPPTQQMNAGSMQQHPASGTQMANQVAMMNLSQLQDQRAAAAAAAAPSCQQRGPSASHTSVSPPTSMQNVIVIQPQRYDQSPDSGKKKDKFRTLTILIGIIVYT